VRKAAKAARTESDLEGDRLAGVLAEELQAARARAANQAEPAPQLEVVPQPDHREIVERLLAAREELLRAQHAGPSDVPRRVELLWVHSTRTHAVWCERRHAATLAARSLTHDVICVAQIEKGAVVERWSFG
jgi:hypothetical protein